MEGKHNTRVDPHDEPRMHQLVVAVKRRAPLDALVLLERESDEVIADVLEQLHPDLAVRILSHMELERSALLLPSIEDKIGEQWSVNLGYPEDSIGRMMEPPLEAFPPTMRVSELTDMLRDIARDRQVVYALVVEDDMTLVGLVAMRE